jgi:hypothetical protein
VERCGVLALDVMLTVDAVLQHLWLECLSKLSILVVHLYIAVFLCLISEHCHILLYPTYPDVILLPLHFGRSTCDCTHLHGVTTVIALPVLPSYDTLLHAT